MVRRFRSRSLCVLVVAACQFDSTGSGFPQGASVAEGPSPTSGSSGEDAEVSSEGAAPGETTQGDVDDDRGTTSEADDTSAGNPAPGGEVGDDAPSADDATDPTATDPTANDATDDEGDDDSEGEDDGANGDVCPASFHEIYWMADGDVNAPMALVPTDGRDQPQAAISEVAESGEVVVTIDLPCAGQYAMWGLVWDYDPGAWASPDPDSLYVDLGGGESVWRYGCQTADASSGLSWQKLSTLAAQPCDIDYVVVEAAAAGSYEVRFRNREAGDGSQVAGIAAIAVSLDLDADPGVLYEPY